MVLGFTTGLLAVSSFMSVLCATVVLPILIPLKLLNVYVLGPAATVQTALFVFPAVFFTSSVAFTAVYLALILNRKGNLVRNQKPLYSGTIGEGWPFVEIYYFSISTMLKGTPQYEGTGWCRWIALAQITVARLLEIAIVTLGIGAILKRGL
jgi:hypothetical protein